MKKINIKDIKQSSIIRSPILPAGFIERVQAYKKLLADVETSTIEETILNFQKDFDPEAELKVWESIASTYEAYTNIHTDLKPNERTFVFASFLTKTLGGNLIAATK